MINTTDLSVEPDQAQAFIDASYLVNRGTKCRL